MNFKTFALALLFLCLTVAWFGVSLYWFFTCRAFVGWFDLAIAGCFVAAGVGMTVHEFRKKKRVHLDEANKHQIP
ncbi:MAG: hypothetical protein K2O55_06670 [Alistipes sp.]|nr:hypothetical protein [Alistipes sp.]MDE7078240.1 hypothetical protein [Alistipes sp.]